MTNKFNHSIKLILALVVILGLANLVGTNVLATGGRQLDSLHQQIIVLEKDNLYLKNQIAQATSLQNLETQAINLGFVPVNQTIAIVTPAPVAYVPQ